MIALLDHIRDKARRGNHNLDAAIHYPIMEHCSRSYEATEWRREWAERRLFTLFFPVTFQLRLMTALILYRKRSGADTTYIQIISNQLLHNNYAYLALDISGFNGSSNLIIRYRYLFDTTLIELKILCSVSLTATIQGRRGCKHRKMEPGAHYRLLIA